MENWIKILIIISTFLILLARIVGGKKIQYLIKFWNIHRYFIYQSGYTISIFNSVNILFFFLRVTLFSIIISVYFFPEKFSEFQLYNFFIISGLISIYICLKFSIEKILSIILNYSNLLIEINRYRIGFKNLIVVHLYFYLLLLIFTPISSNLTILISFVLFFNYLLFSSYYIFKKNFNIAYKFPIYFILYLCTFEIAPAFFLFWYAFKF
ncbi:uncharacterized protein METZ01_LOCUS27752 [marine metagenome]|uniref:DUF4271 domain-containing protein n=1 Tax=marine metagenome TaxID=408172 RepID=A0A381Q7F3_9ZZZZ